MLAARHTLAALSILAAIGFAVGCGSDDGGTGSDKPPSITEAKATLSKDCQEGKAEDKALCDCIANELEAAGNDAEQIRALNKQVNEGKSPPAVSKAAGMCPQNAPSP